MHTGHIASCFVCLIISCFLCVFVFLIDFFRITGGSLKALGGV